MADDDSGSNFRTIVISVVGTLIASALIGLASVQFEMAGWRGHVDATLERRLEAEANASNALEGVRVQGQQLQLIREQIEALRGEIKANREMIAARGE